MLPIQSMWERVSVAKEDSDTTTFFHLLYMGEMLTKLVTLAMTAAVSDERERHRYRLLHRLVRADGLGEWAQVLDEILTGPASQALDAAAKDDQRELTQRSDVGSWQYEATVLLRNVLSELRADQGSMSGKATAREWFSRFVELRNKTRGHGATTPALCAKVCPQLEHSLRLISDNLSLFRKPWAYIHRNLSGKYRVVALSGASTKFDYLKSASTLRPSTAGQLADGVYILFETATKVDLIATNVDVSNFFFPNGSFGDKSFELISYTSDDRDLGDSRPYLSPVGILPPSETEGMGKLDLTGEAFTNLPSVLQGYVSRPSLEKELFDILSNDRHPVVTLRGRGGIGKTSLALSVLHKLTNSQRFRVIVWFSARDIDLLTEGPKLVTPRVLTDRDIADQFVSLMEPRDANEKSFKPITYLAESLTASPVADPILFVFDNFETVKSPTDIFSWLDTHIRLPNKILITTRHRNFKADYPIEVLGMTEDEAFQLINTVAERFRVADLITQPYRENLFHEADGHPYVIKVLIGEVAKARKLVKVERIVAEKDDVLDALFERTYIDLTPAAKRVFLTLSRWRSAVPLLALEAVLLRPINDKMDVEAAVEELVQSSFIERTEADDGAAFITVPLAASIFGKQKCEVSPMRAAVESDVLVLRSIGASQDSGLRLGIQPRIEKLFSYVANTVATDSSRLSEMIPMLEFICRRHAPAWLTLASLYQEIGTEDSLSRAKDALLRLVQQQGDTEYRLRAWEELASICVRTNDTIGEINALVGLCKMHEVSFETISRSANRLNILFRQSYLVLDSEEKRVFVRELVHVIEERLPEASATDLSKLAWLCLHLKDEERARKYALAGLELEPDNHYCQKLIERLNARS